MLGGLYLFLAAFFLAGFFAAFGRLRGPPLPGSSPKERIDEGKVMLGFSLFFELKLSFNLR